MTNTDELRIFMVRVGPTLWDEAGRLVGSTDLPLSPKGVELAAAAAAEASREPRLSVILAARDEASQTAAKTIQAAAGGRIRQSPELHEVDLGLWEGMLREEFAEKFPTACKQWADDPAGVVAPEGESLVMAEERILDELYRALAKAKPADGPIALALRPMAYTLMRLALDNELKSAFCREMTQAPVTEWRLVTRARLKEMRDRAASVTVRA
ncbi:MAG: histidine phosphatase family protein [Phycisphaeraceae bacterium]|nr:histidine phosphatase family protein [Phycisphaeraceae bacterium]MCW5754060.1 histidine phosphatase family protein [Phycisphaeraceae bacterium]